MAHSISLIFLVKLGSHEKHERLYKGTIPSGQEKLTLKLRGEGLQSGDTDYILRLQKYVLAPYAWQRTT